MEEGQREDTGTDLILHPLDAVAMIRDDIVANVYSPSTVIFTTTRYRTLLHGIALGGPLFHYQVTGFLSISALTIAS